jgi:Homeodomain-like domain
MLGTVGPRARGALAALVARRVAAADCPPDGQARPLDTGLCVADRWHTAARGPVADGRRTGGDQPGVAAGDSRRAIARRLRRAPSTVSRELARNRGRRRYRAQRADAAADRRAARPKPAKLAVAPRLRGVVEAKLALCWSPEQIAGWLRVAYPDDPTMRVSHETIYLSLYVQRRRALRRDLRRCLRTGRAMCHPRGTRLLQGRGQLITPSRSTSARWPHRLRRRRPRCDEPRPPAVRTVTASGDPAPRRYAAVQRLSAGSTNERCSRAQRRPGC